MPEIPDLPELDPNDMSDDDLFVVYDNSAGSSKSRKVTRATVMKNIARTGEAANFTESEITVLASDNATFANAKIITGLEFDGGATIATVLSAALSVTTAGTGDGAGETLTKTVTGVLTTDILIASFTTAIPDGVIWQAWISAADTVSFRFFNNSGGAVGTGTYDANVMIVRAS